MNIEHTPGPWYWDDKDALPWTDYDKTDHVPYLINTNGRIVMSGDDIRIRNEADGHLMIAAPDLLAALKDILSGWRYIRQDPAHLSIYGVGWDRAQEAAEAAIAKAEGKA